MKKVKFVKRLKNSYRLVVYDDHTFAEIFSLKLSLLNTYIITGAIVIILVIVGSLLVIFTPLGRFLPANEYLVKRELHSNLVKLDSLEEIMEANFQDFERISVILKGKDSKFSKPPKESKRRLLKSSKKKFKPLKKKTSKEEAILRRAVERADKFNISQVQLKSSSEKSNDMDLQNLYLYPPVDKGILVSEYETSKATPHLGVDITAKKNSHIMSVLGGTVISSSWSLETGYSIVIQHDNGLVSCYKHNSKILRKVGDQVKTGEVIAILGNTGEQTSGPHLHFELWFRGKSLNPKDYIVF